MIHFNILILSLAIITGTAYLLCAYFLIIRPARLRYQSWAYYKVRDDLIALVRDGHLSSDSKTFHFFYPAVNGYLRYIHPLSLSHFARSVVNTNNKATAELDAILKEIEHSPKPVRVVIEDFFDATRFALIDNCIILRILLVFVIVFDFSPDAFPHRKSKVAQRVKPYFKALKGTDDLQQCFAV